MSRRNKRIHNNEMSETVVKIPKVLGVRDMDCFDDDVNSNAYAVSVQSVLPKSLKSNGEASTSASQSSHNFEPKSESTKGTLRYKPKETPTAIKDKSNQLKPNVFMEDSENIEKYLYGGGDDNLEVNMKSEEIIKDSKNGSGDYKNNTFNNNSSSAKASDKNTILNVDSKLQHRTSESSSSASSSSKIKRKEMQLKLPIMKDSLDKPIPGLSCTHHSRRVENDNGQSKQASSFSAVPECRPIMNSNDKQQAVGLLHSRKAKIESLKEKVKILHNKEINQIKSNKSQVEIDGTKDVRLKIQKEIDAASRSIKSIEEQLAKYEQEKAKRDAAAAAIKAAKQQKPLLLNSEATRPESRSAKPSSSTYQTVNRYVDNGNHWCKHCGDVFPLLSVFLNHLHRHHSSVINNVPSSNKPWAVRPTNTRETANLPTSSVKGVEFILPVTTAYYCELCKEFFGDANASQAHLESESHNINYKKYTQTNSDYDRKTESEKSASLAKKMEETDRQLKESLKFAFQQSTESRSSSSENSAQNSASSVPSDPRLRNKKPRSETAAVPLKGILKINQPTISKIDPRESTESDPSTNMKLERNETIIRPTSSNSSTVNDVVTDSSMPDQSNERILPIRIKSEPLDKGYEKNVQDEMRTGPILSESSETRPLIDNSREDSYIEPQSNEVVLQVKVKNVPQDKGYERYLQYMPILDNASAVQYLIENIQRNSYIEPQSNEAVLPVRVKNEPQDNGYERHESNASAAPHVIENIQEQSYIELQTNEVVPPVKTENEQQVNENGLNLQVRPVLSDLSATQPVVENSQENSNAEPQLYGMVPSIKIKDEPKDKGYENGDYWSPN